MHLPTALAVWAMAFALLCWDRLPATARRGLSILASAVGLAFLVAAIRTEGVRESPTLSVFLLGTPYVTHQVTASASLPLYVATGLCLLLGTAGLAVPDDVTRRAGRRYLLNAVGLSLAVTLLRFSLEKMAAPLAWTHAVGITWLVPVVGVFFALNLHAEGRGLGALAATLLAYAVPVRAFVFGLMVVATRFRLGSHYDVSPSTLVRNPFSGHTLSFEPGSLSQLASLGLLPQLVFWPAATVLVGTLVGGMTLLLLRINRREALGPARSTSPDATGTR
jgi:hypothetical protein